MVLKERPWGGEGKGRGGKKATFTYGGWYSSERIKKGGGTTKEQKKKPLREKENWI